ncbi:DNA alkylation repair protein [Mesorhizobium sp. LHD-90]|uniref:DNA alkylation repair protein n=1 Tax=Mesorhizobium sp. LHD-90 TaxID=3071414 RepID=UPI0027DFAC02|nr:DNA alkylation repair protein [Mesorhizobium sp. LHD-90]MDQ6437351.1 DNA alkylation repair protein [Mesorhizobium sp. LHD-90]
MQEQNDAGAPALKEIFDRARLAHIARETAAVCAGFDAGTFMARATENLDALGIMQRMRQVAVSFHAALPGGYERNIETLSALAPRIGHNFAAISLAEYVALYGLDRFDISMKALHFFTRFGSAEFAVRPFLSRDLNRTLAVMEGWAEDENEHVRRLASEGCRPRLPWAARISALIEDPSPVGAILETLKSDPSLYVRKSVANHLNDIGKDHPEWMLERLEGWPLADPRTAWIAKHALRSLIKKGDLRALGMIGAGGKPVLKVETMTATPSEIRLGERLFLAAKVVSTSDASQRLVVDYAIHYVKKNGTPSCKVFKLKVFDLAPGATCDLSISQTVKDFTTRKHFAGHHRVELLANGETVAESGFNLLI